MKMRPARRWLTRSLALPEVLPQPDETAWRWLGHSAAGPRPHRAGEARARLQAQQRHGWWL